MSADPASHGGAELAAAVRELYAAGQTDYSFEPVILADTHGTPIGRIKDGDSVIFCLRRGEREVQLTEAFVESGVGGFPRVNFDHLPFIILTLYHEKFKDLPVAFAPAHIEHTLAETVSQAGFRQMHISESEKFAHVTFFLNGGNNLPFNGERDIRVPSPRGVSPDQVPELSLPLVVDGLIKGMADGYELIAANFANGDVIGHTTSNEAKIKCAEIIDTYLGLVGDAALSNGYAVLVTADHGNLEEMITPAGTPHVSHTTNPVPFLLISPQSEPSVELLSGSLADIAPTILSMLGIHQPAEMTGKSLIKNGNIYKSEKVLLVILDGWGIGKDDATNPIYLAHTPNWDRLRGSSPHSQLQAAGEAVGLKLGKAGNSEAGHMNIGAGRVILQDDVRLDAAMLDGSFRTNEVFLQTMADVKQRRSSLHLICLLSEKSSHGSVDYPLELLRMAKAQGLSEIFIHVIFDGRSTEPGSAPSLLEKFELKISEIGVGNIVTGMGRGIALDRDGDYQKTRLAYEAMVFGTGKTYQAEWS